MVRCLKIMNNINHIDGKSRVFYDFCPYGVVSRATMYKLMKAKKVNVHKNERGERAYSPIHASMESLCGYRFYLAI